MFGDSKVGRGKYSELELPNRELESEVRNTVAYKQGVGASIQSELVKTERL